MLHYERNGRATPGAFKAMFGAGPQPLEVASVREQDERGHRHRRDDPHRPVRCGGEQGGCRDQRTPAASNQGRRSRWWSAQQHHSQHHASPAGQSTQQYAEHRRHPLASAEAEIQRPDVAGRGGAASQQGDAQRVPAVGNPISTDHDASADLPTSITATPSANHSALGAKGVRAAGISAALRADINPAQSAEQAGCRRPTRADIPAQP